MLGCAYQYVTSVSEIFMSSFYFVLYFLVFFLAKH